MTTDSATTAPQHYDIFLSYRSLHFPWMEVLAHNLEAQGYSVFLDRWALKPGDNFTREIFQALDTAQYALLLATPEAADSGWVQEEYEYMFNLAKNRDDFRWIPLVLGEFPDFPFLSNVQAVDFGDSSAELYRVAFQKLLCGLRDEAPGANPRFDGALQFPQAEPTLSEQTQPTQQQLSFIDSVCSYLDAGTPLMVLAQADTSTQHYVHALKRVFAEQYAHETLLHLYPPTSSRADSADYFGRLAQQSGCDAVINESWKWADALRDRLSAGEELVILLTGFENGAEAARGELAGELRGLVEEFPFNLKLVVIGGERLAAMKYQHGAMSLLNRLEEMRLPDSSVQDVRSIYLQRYAGLQLSDDELNAMLVFTGGHPRLLEACLQAVRRGDSDWQTAIEQSPLPSQLFTRFRADGDHVPLCKLLQNDDVGMYDAWPQDDLLRRLYWQNLLTMDKGRFVWRCEFVRDCGRRLLGCDDV